MSYRFAPRAIGACAGLLIACQSQGIIIHSPSMGYGGYDALQAWEVGQTFTATADETVDRIGFLYVSMNRWMTPSTITMNVYSGDQGNAGELLRQIVYQPEDVVATTDDAPVWTDFVFEPLQLEEGAAYSVMLHSTWYWGIFTSRTDTYAGGTRIEHYQGQEFIVTPGNDYNFRVIPSPGVLSASMLLGCASLIRRRR
ncbi:MAG: hypothetical protein ACF8GE_12345 [Phycisphaerales bacterium JB043]